MEEPPLLASRGLTPAFDMFVYKIAAKAAEMATSMCGMDTPGLTAGIGEHASAVRAGVADRLACASRWSRP